MTVFIGIVLSVLTVVSFWVLFKIINKEYDIMFKIDIGDKLTSN